MNNPKNGSQGLVAPQDDGSKGVAVSAKRIERSETPLGSLTNTPSSKQTTITNSPSNHARSAVVLRFALQAKARELLPDHRVGWCLRRFRAGNTKIGVVHAKSRGSAYFDGLMRCGRVWVCPVCASKIAETRRAELSTLLLEAREVVLGYTSEAPEYYPRWFLTMLTFTIQHRPEESAADVLARIDRAWQRYYSGGWAQGFRKRFYIVGTIRALEMTHGADGWHPHLHLLQFHDSYLREQFATAPLYHPSQPEMLGLARDHWSHSAGKVGGYAHSLFGVALTVGEVANYPIKSDAEREMKRWGMSSEITKQTVKRGRGESRSLTDLLIDAAKGDDLAAKFWIEGTNALAGHKQIEPSKGLWTMLGRKLKSDEEAAEDEAEASDEVLALLTWEQWKIVLLADARGDVLDIASMGDADALWSYLESLGVHHD